MKFHHIKLNSSLSKTSNIFYPNIKTLIESQTQKHLFIPPKIQDIEYIYKYNCHEINRKIPSTKLNLRNIILQEKDHYCNHPHKIAYSNDLLGQKLNKIRPNKLTKNYKDKYFKKIKIADIRTMFSPNHQKGKFFQLSPVNQSKPVNNHKSISVNTTISCSNNNNGQYIFNSSSMFYHSFIKEIDKNTSIRYVKKSKLYNSKQVTATIRKKKIINRK